MNNKVLGIFAHVDSGKTTLSEAILYKTGVIRKKGRVDNKDTFMDNDSIEKERGITVFSNQAQILLSEKSFTLIDTPGHIDFSPDAERVMKILDFAVLIVSAPEGVQSHTETLWKMLFEYKIPVFIFVNKMDILHGEKNDVIHNLRKRLSPNCIDFTDTKKSYEEMAFCSERLFSVFEKEGDLDEEEISLAVFNREIYPVVFGSALKGEGIDSLLDIISKYTHNKKYKDEFAAKVYKIGQGLTGERLTFVKITGGSLKVRSLINYKGRDGEDISEKINSIRIYSGNKFKAEDEAFAGDVCAVTGLSETYASQGLGEEKGDEVFLQLPCLRYKVLINDGSDPYKVYEKLLSLKETEPSLDTSFNSFLKEIKISVMGEIQLEVIARIMKDKFGYDIGFTYESIAYKETIKSKVTGVGHFEPLRHYAEVHLSLTPLDQGSGLLFDSECPEDILDKKYQNLILYHLKEKQHVGVLTGSPITDLKITLTNGRAHIKHTAGGDFRQATYRALRQALMKAESVVLEPWYDFKIVLPSELLGKVMTDIENMGGKLYLPEALEDDFILTGSAPVKKMREYQSQIASSTGGRGKLTLSFAGYFECTEEEKVIEEIGYNAEEDLENTADSVFCSGGAGFNVSWRSVDEYKHIKDDEYEKQNNVSRWVKNALCDDELKRILERTYGPLERKKKDEEKVYEFKKEEKAVKIKKPIGEEYLLVDGYNIIHSFPELKKIAEKDMSAAREELIGRMCSYQSYAGMNLILVFDAYKVKGGKESVEKVHNISVVYTKEAQSADMYIEKTARTLVQKGRVRVATSDSLEQIIILGSGALRVSAEFFYLEVCEAEKSIREYLSGNNM